MNATLARLHRLTAPTPDGPDGALVEAFLAGDQDAFALLVRRHAGLVFATCRRVLRHQQDAEDAFQATFLVLARRAADVWPRAAVGSWLFGVAHRVALKARTARARRAVRAEPLEDVPGAEHTAAEPDTAELVQRTVAGLPEVYRAAVVACDLQGLSRKAAAERLGWSEGTLSGRLARARRLLAARLSRKGLCLPAAGAAAVLVNSEAAPAALIHSTCRFATAETVAAPVLALTEGAVQSMALFKLKAMAAVMVVACAVGFGAFAASGSGRAGAQPKEVPGRTGAAPGAAKQNPPAKPPTPAPGPRLELAQQELAVIRQELLATGGKFDKDSFDKLQARLEAITRLLDANDRLMNPEPPLKPLADSVLLQGTWWVQSLTDGDKAVPLDPKDPMTLLLNGSTLALPYKETGRPGWNRREYRVAVDGTQSPKPIDLIRPGEPVGRGIYEFTAPAKTCADCHKPDQRNPNPFANQPLRDVIGLCVPGLKTVPLGLRLAFSVDGKRPAKFGGAGVIVFELTRAQKPQEEAKPPAPTIVAEQHRKAVIEVQRALVLLKAAEAGAAKAQAALDAAHAEHELAQDRLKAAEKAVAELTQPNAPTAKDGPAFTIHVRTRTAPEKVIRVPATGNETVLDALAKAPDVQLKADRASAWVVRGDELLPVDLVGITQHGVTTTNYVLKPGDRLFVQEKPAR